jgi:hypothetical protein
MEVARKNLRNAALLTFLSQETGASVSPQLEPSATA